MRTILNIFNDIKLSRNGEAYVLVETFELWEELYSQIISNRDLMSESNYNSWFKDWNKGTSYIRQEFQSMYNEKLKNTTVRIQKKYDDTFKLFVTTFRHDSYPEYYFTVNEYEVDLV